MTKQEMRKEFFFAKENLRQALIGVGVGDITPDEFRSVVQGVWRRMNELTPKFK